MDALNFGLVCGNSNGDELDMELLQINMLKHICGDNSAYSHDEMLEPSEGKEWLDLNGESMQIIPKHCIESNWFGLFKYCVRNRHT